MFHRGIGHLWKAEKYGHYPVTTGITFNTGFTGEFRFVGEWAQESVAMEKQNNNECCLHPFIDV